MPVIGDSWVVFKAVDAAIANGNGEYGRGGLIHHLRMGITFLLSLEFFYLGFFTAFGSLACRDLGRRDLGCRRSVLSAKTSVLQAKLRWMVAFAGIVMANSSAPAEN